MKLIEGETEPVCSLNVGCLDGIAREFRIFAGTRSAKSPAVSGGREAALMAPVGRCRHAAGLFSVTVTRDNVRPEVQLLPGPLSTAILATNCPVAGISFCEIGDSCGGLTSFRSPRAAR